MVFAGFVTLVLLSQLSAHFFATAIPSDLVAKNAAVLLGIQRTSTELAFASAAMGLIFAGAVLIITRQKVAADVDIYRATGLQPGSAFVRLLRSHSVGPLEWVAGATAVTALVDAEFGLNALLPIGLAISFAVLLFAWLAFLTSASFSQRGFEGTTGARAG
jgi:hypothetical protein